MNRERANGLLPAAWATLALGLAGAVASARALMRGDGLEPGMLALLVVFVPYIAAAMLLQITGKARLVIIALTLPAFVDVFFGCAFTFGRTPAWDDGITWQLLRAGAGTFLLLIALGIGLWLEREDARAAGDG